MNSNGTIGALALYLLFAWLISAAGAAWLAERKGYTERNRHAITASRVDSTRAVSQAIARCTKPPRVWLNSCSATIY